ACQRGDRHEGVDDMGEIESLTRGSRLRDDAPPTRFRRSAAPPRNPTRALTRTAPSRHGARARGTGFWPGAQLPAPRELAPDAGDDRDSASRDRDLLARPG